jgi:pilus assembly protein Flp/PilA
VNPSLKTQKRERGQGLVEYALILVLVAVVVIGVLSVVGGGVSNVYCTVIGGLNRTSTCTGQQASQPGTLTSSQYAVTSNQYRVYISYNGTRTDGVSVTCSASSGPVIVQNDGGGSYVLTLTSSFHGSFSCSMSYQSTSGSFSGNFS